MRIGRDRRGRREEIRTQPMITVQLKIHLNSTLTRSLERVGTCRTVLLTNRLLSSQLSLVVGIDNVTNLCRTSSSTTPSSTRLRIKSRVSIHRARRPDPLTGKLVPWMLIPTNQMPSIGARREITCQLGVGHESIGLTMKRIRVHLRAIIISESQPSGRDES